MIVLDTHVWIWWIASPDRLSGPARQGERLQPLAGLQGLVALGVEQIMKELHVQLVILDNEDLLGHLGSGAVTEVTARRGLPHLFLCSSHGYP